MSSVWSLLGGIFTLIGLVLDVGIGLSAARLGELLQTRPSIGQKLDRVAGTVFGILALRLVVQTRTD